MALDVVDVGQQVEQGRCARAAHLGRAPSRGRAWCARRMPARSRPAAHEAAVQPHGVHRGLEVALAELPRRAVHLGHQVVAVVDPSESGQRQPVARGAAAGGAPGPPQGRRATVRPGRTRWRMQRSNTALQQRAVAITRRASQRRRATARRGRSAPGPGPAGRRALGACPSPASPRRRPRAVASAAAAACLERCEHLVHLGEAPGAEQPQGHAERGRQRRWQGLGEAAGEVRAPWRRAIELASRNRSSSTWPASRSRRATRSRSAGPSVTVPAERAGQHPGGCGGPPSREASLADELAVERVRHLDERPLVRIVDARRPGGSARAPRARSLGRGPRRAPAAWARPSARSSRTAPAWSDTEPMCAPSRSLQPLERSLSLGEVPAAVAELHPPAEPGVADAAR